MGAVTMGAVTVGALDSNAGCPLLARNGVESVVERRERRLGQLGQLGAMQKRRDRRVGVESRNVRAPGGGDARSCK